METKSVVFFNTTNYPQLNVKPIIAAWQTATPENIGSLMRLSANLGSQEVYILGAEFNFRLSSIKKTAGSSFNDVRLHFSEPEEFFRTINPEYQIVAIETCSSSQNIFQATLPERTVFLLGAERTGLPAEIIERCHLAVHIPMTGPCKSMNISHALAVCLFEWQRQILFKQ